MSDKIQMKIQMTEEQAREYDKKRRAFTCETCGKTPCKAGEEDCDYQFLKKNGYIIKSELQQKVEEAENFYAEWKNYRIGEVITYGGEAELVNFIYETMQLLKQSHPEFK